MELRHLRYFIAVAEELHFGRAAERLRMTQPPLSQQIQQLEEELGVALFRRDSRHVALTDAGKVFLDHARRTLGESDEAIAEARRADRGEIGSLRIGFAANAAHEALPAIVRRYRAEYPRVRLTLHELASGEQVEALRERRLDVGFLSQALPKDEFQSKPVLRDRLLVALPAGHPLAAQEVVRIAQLREQPWLVFPREYSPAVFDMLTSAFDRAGGRPQVAQEARYTATLVSFVSAGMGFCFVSGFNRHLPRPGVVFLPVDDAALHLDLSVAWRTDNASAVLGGFLSVVDEYLAERARPARARSATAG